MLSLDESREMYYDNLDRARIKARVTECEEWCGESDGPECVKKCVRGIKSRQVNVTQKIGTSLPDGQASVARADNFVMSVLAEDLSQVHQSDQAKLIQPGVNPLAAKPQAERVQIGQVEYPVGDYITTGQQSIANRHPFGLGEPMGCWRATADEYGFVKGYVLRPCGPYEQGWPRPMTTEERAAEEKRNTEQMRKYQELVQGNVPAGSSKEVRITDPETGGQKGQKLAQIGAVDPNSLLEVGKVAGFGATKYERYNFVKGYAWSLSFDAMQRHMLAWWGGEDNDPESKLPHLAHAAWHALTLLTFQLRGRGRDDRFSTALVNDGK